MGAADRGGTIGTLPYTPERRGRPTAAEIGNQFRPQGHVVGHRRDLCVPSRIGS
jgi:hypothetical protein